ncbi:MAG: efflux RND transporter periplasmic adaptor subunit [Chloroflexi bacterium]|nr:efflux RND transporter periplasmic adaptor subunit [Chloroflexota bacterium]
MTKKRIFMTLGAIVLVGAGVTFATNRSQTASADTTTQTGQVTRATLSSVIESTGSASPESNITLSFGAAGTVDKVNVQLGDLVKQGDVLAEIDTIDLELAVAQAEQSYLSQQAAYSMTVNADPAEVAAAELSVSNAVAAYKLAQQKYQVNSTDSVMLSCDNLDSAKQTYDDAVNAYNAYISNWRVQVNGSAEISPQKSQLDRAKAAYEQAVINCNLAKSSVNDTGIKSAYASLVQAQANLESLLNPSERTLTAAKIKLEQAELVLEEAKQQLEEAKIVAPFDGLITNIAAIVGGASGSASIELTDIGQYHVDVLVDETEIEQVQAGQQANITFDALPEVTVTGEVARIDPAGTVSNGVVNYLVRVNLDATEAALRSDMTANVQVVLDTHTDVLAVPGTAIRSDGQNYYVNVAGTDGTAQRVDVTTGYTDGELTEVAGDLQEGQTIYLGELTTTTTTTQGRGMNLFGIRIGG